MEITQIEVLPYQIPNRYEHEIASATLSALENILIKIHTDTGIVGLGEGVAGPKWNQNPLKAETVILQEKLVPVLIGQDPTDVVGIWDVMNAVLNEHYSVKAGIDIAIHDLIGRAYGIPVWKVLGGAHRLTIDVEGPGYGIGFMNAEDAVEYAMTAVNEGCTQIELKCGRASGAVDDLEVVRAVHEACGPAVSLKVDITEGYDFKTALSVLPQMAELGVVLAEQPLPRHQLADLARLREAVPLDIVLDESIGSPADMLRVVQLGAADAIHLKYAMLGGFHMCQKISAICEAAGIGLQGGTGTPSGVGLAAAHHLTATLPNLVRGCHGSPLGRAHDDLVRDPVPAFATTITLDDSPGLGVEVDQDKVQTYGISF